MLIKTQILAFNHDFPQALEVLTKIINHQGQSQTQALLMRANIHQVVGDYNRVKRDCTQLLLRTSSLVTAGCFFSINGFTSNPEKTKTMIAQLRTLLTKTKDVPQETQLWIIGLMAEAASLSNDLHGAEALLLTGLSAKPIDGYLLSLYADLLLKQDRYQDCINLLRPHIQQTALLVRFLAAEIRLSGSNVSRSQQTQLNFRIKEDDIKNDQRHLREYAYYQLYVQKNYSLALHNALTNWNNQKELIDSLILYRAAEHFERQDVLRMLSDWREKNQVEVDFSAQSLTL